MQNLIRQIKHNNLINLNKKIINLKNIQTFILVKNINYIHMNRKRDFNTITQTFME